MKYVIYTSSHVDKESLDFRITVFPSRPAFLRYLRTKTNKGTTITGKGKAAMFLSFERPWLNDIFAEIILYKGQTTADDVAHELTHLVMCIMRQWKIDVKTKEGEEELAVMMGKNFDHVMRWVKRNTRRPSRT